MKRLFNGLGALPGKSNISADVVNVVRYHFRGPKGGGLLLAFPSGRYSHGWGGQGGFWEQQGSEFVLRSDHGVELRLKSNDKGFSHNCWSLIPSAAEFIGFWPEFDPTHALYSPLLGLPLAITSTWNGISEAAVVISGENALIRSDEDGLVWQHGGRKGRAQWFIGVPKINDSRALHVPHLYDYWSRLRGRRPARKKAILGLSWVANNISGFGGLTRRRLEVARGLARWFPLAASAPLRPALADLDNVTFYDVPRTVLGKCEFLSGYAFNLCFENSRTIGYLTEKPFDALVAGAVPVYEGDPEVGTWIDPTALIDCTSLGINEIANRIRQAQLDGLPERVAAERERLMRVSLEEMVARVESFVGHILAEKRDIEVRPAARDRIPNASSVEPRETVVAGSLSRLTVVIKTILRPDALRATVASFQRVLGNEVQMVVVDDSPEPDGSDLPPQVRFIPMPFDCGLSAGRNRGVAEVQTEFVFLTDDDSLLESTTGEIRRCLALLDEGFDLVGSEAYDFEERGETLAVVRRPIRALQRVCDATLNFFIARTSILRDLPWDEEMKVHPEHADFFMRLKCSGAVVAGTSLLRFRNLATRHHAYSELRKRQYMQQFRDRWGFDHIVWNRHVQEQCENPVYRSGETRRGRICLGTSPLDGWLNIGEPIGRSWCIRCNLKEGLPLDLHSLEFVTVDRVLEKLTYQEGAALLSDVYRILSPRGRVRMATIDLAFVLALGNEVISTAHEAYVQWFTDAFLGNVPGYDPAFVINQLMRGDDCRFLHDATTLADVLEEAGFIGVTACVVGVSDYIELCGAEYSGNTPDQFTRMHLLVLEASKP